MDSSAPMPFWPLPSLVWLPQGCNYCNVSGWMIYLFIKNNGHLCTRNWSKPTSSGPSASECLLQLSLDTDLGWIGNSDLGSMCPVMNPKADVALTFSQGDIFIPLYTDSKGSPIADSYSNAFWRTNIKTQGSSLSPKPMAPMLPMIVLVLLEIPLKSLLFQRTWREAGHSILLEEREV